VVIAKKWRERLNYTAISLFVAWHTTAMVLGPFPDSEISRSLRVLWRPYLTFFRLEASWAFFAPSIGMQRLVHYVIEDADGKKHTFEPTIAVNHHFHPKYSWFSFIYEGAFIDHPDIFGKAPVALLCQKHALLRPVSITVFHVQQEKNFWPQDHLRGKHPLDSEFVTTYRRQVATCPGDLAPSKE